MAVRYIRWFGVLAYAAFLAADPITVRQLEGEIRGFLVLRGEDGAIVADGDLMQTTHGGSVTLRLTFHFKDGSLQDETSVFSQRGQFRLLTDHLVQKGPVFKHPIDMTVNAATGMVKIAYKDDKGNDKVESKQMVLPLDLANGIVPILLKNLPAASQSATLSMVVAAPKPMLVKLAVSADGEDSFSTGGASHKATRFTIKVDIGGIKGVVAPVVGKQPPDLHMWILRGECPTFVKSDGPLFESGPIWRVELVSPVWPKGQ